MNSSQRSENIWIVFDVDGVLVDPSESYDLAVKLTTETLLGEMGFEVDVGLDAIRRLRVKGAFGDDFDLSEALILGAVLGDLNDFVDAFPEGAGVEWVREKTDVQIDRDRLERLFNTLYLGDRYPGRLFDTEGLWKNERPLVDIRLLRRVASRYRVGVITGRDRLELGLAEEIIGYHFENAVTREEALKPNPKALELLCGIASGIYVGDTVNDRILVEEYNRAHGGDLFQFVMVKADVESVNDFLRSLFSEMKNHANL